MAQPIQDTLQFALTAEHTVTNDTIKLTATLAGTVMPGMTEDGIKDQMRQVLRNFVQTDWQLSGYNRGNDNTGLEKVSVTATARVKESEYYALDERRRKASVSGMQINRVDVDISPPLSMIEKAEAELRQTIVKKAQTELHVMSKALDRDYRIGSIAYDDTGAYGNRQGGAVALASMSPSNYGGGGSSAEAIGNTMKIVMHATVELRCSMAAGKNA